MAFFDLSGDQLRDYRPQVRREDDFESFWRSTLETELARPLDVQMERLETPLTTLDVRDVSFAGFGGQRVHAWLLVPAGAVGPLRTVVQYRGYSGGRGYPWRESLYATAGYAHLVLDSRGQGWKQPALRPLTPDEHPSAGGTRSPGLMTVGIESPETYYYRRLYVDAVRLLQLAGQSELVDRDRIAVVGTSQGGAMTIAAAGLAAMAGLPLAAAVPNVPFLCDFGRAVGLTDAYPYQEIADWLNGHPADEDQVFRTLSYVDGVNLAPYAQVPALFSTALMDQVCPPSTVYAAYNAWGHQQKEITVYRWNGHEGGGDHHSWHALHWLRETLA